MKFSRPLLTFAFVKESLDNTGDFVQGLMPLFIPIVKELAGEDFRPSQFAEALNNLYGLHVRPEVIEDWAKRLADQGLLHPVEENQEIVRYINIAPEDAQDELKRSEVDEILDEFIEYILKKLAEHDISVEITQIEEAIFDRLKTMEFHDLFYKQQPSHLRDTTLRLPVAEEETESDHDEESDVLEAHLDYLCASFALGLRDSAPGKFDVLLQIAGGALVSEVVLDLRTPPRAGQDASSLTVYIDAPLIIDALNIAGEEEYEFAHALLTELRELKASLRLFNSGADEIRRIFHSVLEAIRDHNPVQGSIGARLRTDPLVRTRILDISKHLEERLAELLIGIVNFDDTYADLYKYFSVAREKDLVACIRPMREIVARETDARAASNVFRLLSDSPKRANVFSSIAIFLSKNAAVVRQADKFFKREHLISEDQASPFITDKYMAGLLWVVKGGQGDDITRRKLVANCAAAISPRRDVITKMYQVLSVLDEKDALEFEALMTEKRPAYYLMEHSLGDATLITPDNAHKILEQVRLATAEKVIQEKDIEKEEALGEQASRHREEMARVAAEKESVREQAVRASNEARELNDEILWLEEEIKNVKSREVINEEKLLLPCLRAGTIGGLWWAAKIHVPASIVLLLIGAFITQSPKIVYLVILFLVWQITAFSQYWFVPNLLFAKRLQNAQQKAFQKKVKQAGLEEIADKFRVDWSKRKLIRNQMTTKTPPE